MGITHIAWFIDNIIHSSSLLEWEWTGRSNFLLTPSLDHRHTVTTILSIENELTSSR